MEVIAFTKVALPYGWLGNMAPYEVVTPPGLLKGQDGMTFRTTEALFQAMRFDDPQIRIAIWREKSPMGAKMTAKHYADKMVVQPRSPQDLENMRKVLLLKVTQHSELDDQLVATGDAQIIEDCSSRRNDSGLFWGAANVDGMWVGRNELGKLWMELRKQLLERNARNRQAIKDAGLDNLYGA